MHKRILPILICMMLVLFTTFVYAVEEYAFDLEYEGKIIVGEEKAVNVTLVGKNGTIHSKVRIKVDISGPSTPKLIAYDSAGAKHDIAQIGYWGPDSGFPVQGTFENKTPITATFDKAGTYKIVLSLIDLSNTNSVITSKTINVTVEEKNVVNNTVQNTVNNTMNNNVLNNIIEEIPQTGTSVFEYSLCIIVTILTIVVGYIIIRNGKEK